MRTLSKSSVFFPAILIAGMCLFATAPFFAHAQSTADGTTATHSTADGSTAAGGASTGLKNPLNASSLDALLHDILSAVVELGSIFLVFMLVYVGFLFVVARGNEEALKKAREALVWTVIGGLILLGAEAISLVISQTAQAL